MGFIIELCIRLLKFLFLLDIIFKMNVIDFVHELGEECTLTGQLHEFT